jgi:hypothetical protein
VCGSLQAGAPVNNRKIQGPRAQDPGKKGEIGEIASKEQEITGK